MTEANLPAPQENNFVTKLMHETLQTMTHADEQEALERVRKLREKNPQATLDELAELVIRNKCMQAGAIGAVTASPTLIPGLGTVIALTFGTAVDIRMMYKLQGELVLELIDLYAPTLPLENKRNVLMVVTGISIGANRVISQSGQEIASKATQRLAVRFSGVAAEEIAEGATVGVFAKSVSTMLGVATSAGINMVTTYTIGRRAQAYLKQGPEAMEDWTASLRTITGVDERKLIAWLMETTRTSWQLIRHRSKDLGAKLVTAGQSAKEVYVVQANKTGKRVVDAGNNGFSRLVDLGQRAGSGIASGAGAVAETVRSKFKRNDKADEQAIKLVEADAPPPTPTPAVDSPEQGG
jgi:hypothetical protein